MKLRIRGNAVRFRLQQGEVRALTERGCVEEHTRLGARPDERFTYRLELSDEKSEPFVTWENGRLTVFLPTALARNWAADAQLTLEAMQPVADGDVLRILIEKDLACLAPRAGEDDRDAFPNPAACLD